MTTLEMIFDAAVAVGLLPVAVLGLVSAWALIVEIWRGRP